MSILRLFAALRQRLLARRGADAALAADRIEHPEYHVDHHVFGQP